MEPDRLDPEPQPQLLLGLPPLALHVLLSALGTSSKETLLRTCKAAREAVMQHTTQLLVYVRDDFDATAGDKLCAQLSKRTEQLDRAIDLREAHGDGLEQVARMLPKVATLQYLTPSGNCCVTDLEIWLPNGTKEQQSNSDQDEEPPQYPWLAVVGSAFKDVARLNMFSESGNTRLDAAFFVGLAACSNLTRLALDGSWDLGTELWSSPQLLRMWLPHVTELKCDCGFELLVLIQGLGPSLELLDLRYTPELSCEYETWWADLQKALSSCHKLQYITLPSINQLILDSLVSLPALTYVKTGNLEGLTQPRLVSQSVWQELDLAVDTKHPVIVDQLAMLPLNTVEPVIVSNLLIEVPMLALSDGEALTQTPVGQHEEQRQAIARLAAAHKLQWAGELMIRNHTGPEILLDGFGAPAPELDDAAAAAAVIAGAPCLQRLHTTIASAKPLAARGCHTLSLEYYVPNGMRADLAESTAATLGAVFGPQLTTLLSGPLLLGHNAQAPAPPAQAQCHTLRFSGPYSCWPGSVGDVIQGASPQHQLWGHQS